MGLTHTHLHELLPAGPIRSMYMSARDIATLAHRR